MEDKKILAFYDVMGIQNFIFSTNKLKENIGSSNIVEYILAKHLKDILISLKENNNYILIDKLEENEKFLEKDFEILLVYIAGGNAFLIFKSENLAKEVSFELSKKILEETGGLLNLAVAYKETDFQNFSKDYLELIDLIDKNKYEFIRTQPLLGIGITMQELSSGLPTQILQSSIDEGIRTTEYISYPTYKKQQLAKNTYYENEFLDEDNKKKYLFPRNIDELGQKRGENYIAVVHIDGNEIGAMKHDLLQSITDPHQALYMLYDFSIKLNSIFKNSVKAMIRDLIKSFEDDEFKKNFKKFEGDYNPNLPIRPLIMKGDDITFISNGKLGVSLAQNFLKKLEIEKKKFIINGKERPITASCGVLITKTRFPFYRAYELSEELCRSAKIKGKIVEGKNSEFYKKGHWIDFHICHSGISDQLKDIRQQKYNIAGINSPPTLKLESNDSIELEYPEYNLLRRPWCLVGDSKPEYLWEKLEKIINDLSSKEWPKNKLMKFKKALLTSKEQVDQFLVEISADEDLKIEEDVWEGNITPYFDAIELLEYYLPLIDGGNNNED